jgi:hypothetical protein
MRHHCRQSAVTQLRTYAPVWGAIDGLSLANSPEQVGAIGPAAVWDAGRFFLYANAYHEFGAENRPEGNKLVLRVEWIVTK